MKHHSFEKRFDHQVLRTIATIIRSVVWLLVPAWLVIYIYDIQGVSQQVIWTYLCFVFLFFGFVFPYVRFVRFWLLKETGAAPLVQGFLCRCFSFVILLISFDDTRKALFRRHRIAKQWFFFDVDKHMRKEIERVKHNADLKVRLLKENRIRDTAKERKRLQKLLTWAQKRKDRYMTERFVFVARAISQHIREIEDHCHFHEDNLTGLFHRYQHAFDFHKDIIKGGYNHRMSPGYEAKLPDISPRQTTIEGKLLYLAVLIRSHTDNHYDRLDFEKSDFAVGRYVYGQPRSAIDIAHWRKSLPAINAYLGGEWMVEPLDGTSLVLSQLKELPVVMRFEDEFLKKGEIFYGFNVRTGERYYNDLEKIPHHMVVGQSGSGKSVFLNQIIASVLYNIDAFEKVYLVDLKGGVELAKYAPLHEALQLVDDYDDLPGLVAEIYQTLRNRLKEMRDTGETLYKGKHILFIVDEYAQINQFEPITKEEKENHKQLLSYLNRISQLGRATRITIWAQLQKATVDNISASFRNNLQTKICFKVHSNSDAATVFGNTDDLPGVASIGGFKNLAKGRFILSDDVNGERIYMQAAMMDDKIPLARLVQTAGDARVVSEVQVDDGKSEPE